MEVDFNHEGVDLRTVSLQPQMKTPNFSQLTQKKLEEYFKSGKIPTRSLLAMTNETKLKLVEALGPQKCQAGIMCVHSKSKDYHLISL